MSYIHNHYQIQQFDTVQKRDAFIKRNKDSIKVILMWEDQGSVGIEYRRIPRNKPEFTPVCKDDNYYLDKVLI